MDKNNTEKTNKAFQGKISKSKENFPNTIDWSALQKNIANKTNSDNKSIWGFVQDQEKISKNKKD